MVLGIATFTIATTEFALIKEVGADSDHDRIGFLSFTITPDGKISALHLDESNGDNRPDL
jgi:hypothetical protein